MSNVRICPKCGKEYTDAPATSRRNNQLICSDCGTRESLEDARSCGYISEELSRQIEEAAIAKFH